MPIGNKFDEREAGWWKIDPLNVPIGGEAGDITNVGNLNLGGGGELEDGGGGGGGGEGAPSRPTFNWGKAPRFDAPEFMLPTYEAALAEPGYQFRLESGRNALENAAAARGVLRTGGTLKDILEYGQNYGAQEYSNVFNRALQAYNAQFQAAQAEYAPRMTEWLTKAAGEQAAGLAAFQAAMMNANRGGGGGYDPILDQILNTPPPAAPF
jgi:hypothetical protein